MDELPEQPSVRSNPGDGEDAGSQVRNQIAKPVTSDSAPRRACHSLFAPAHRLSPLPYARRLLAELTDGVDSLTTAVDVPKRVSVFKASILQLIASPCGPQESVIDVHCGRSAVIADYVKPIHASAARVEDWRAALCPD